MLLLTHKPQASCRRLGSYSFPNQDADTRRKKFMTNQATAQKPLTAASWLASHGLTQQEIKAKNWQIKPDEIKYPVHTSGGIKYQSRTFKGKSRFYCEAGLKTSQYFYTPAELKGTQKLIICAGASDCLNAYLAFDEEVDCIGVLGESIIPSELLRLKYKEFIIAYDADKTGQENSQKLASKLQNVKLVNWALFSNVKDLSELAAKHGRQAIIQLIDAAKLIERSSLDIEAIKRSESAFRCVVGNIPENAKFKFSPNGLQGDSWTFYQEKSGIWYLRRWSTNETLSIIDYVQEVKRLEEKGVFEYLTSIFPEFVRRANCPTIQPTAKTLEPQAKTGENGQTDKSDTVSLSLIQEKLETFEIIDKDRELDLQKLVPIEIANLFEQISNARAFPKEHLLTMFLPLAASLCGKSKVVVKRGFEEGDSWIEPVNLFAFVLAGSGSGKSPALNTLLNPVKELQRQADSLHKVEMQEFNEQQIQQFSKKEKKLAQKFYSENSENTESEQPKKKIFVSTGTTPEAVGRAENPSGGILYKHDEATIFLNDLIGYRQGASNTTFWNCIWGAVSQRVQRISGDRELEGIAASLIALGHPGKTISKFKEVGGIKEADTEGVYARYLICTKTAEAEELPFETPQIALKGLLENLYNNLVNDYRPLKEDGWHKYELSEEAQRHFWELRNLTVRLQKASGDECRAIFYPKMLSNIGRIALVLHKVKAAIADEKSTYLIPLDTIKQAIEIGIYYFEQSLYVYKYGEESQTDREELKLHKLFNQILEVVEKSKFTKKNGYITVGKLKDNIREFKNNKTELKEIEEKYLVPLINTGYLAKSDKGYTRTNLKALKFVIENCPSVRLSDETTKALEPQALQPSTTPTDILPIGQTEEIYEGGLDF